MGFKDTLGNFVEKVKGVFTREDQSSLESITAEMEQEKLEETSDLPKGAAYQVNLFEGLAAPDRNGAYYHRVYAKKVSLEPHLLVIERGGEQYAFRSGYDLLKLEKDGMLLAFAFAPEGKTARLFKLPQDLRIPTSETAVEIYPPQSQLEKGQAVDGASGVKRFLIELNRLREAFKAGWDRLQNYATEYAKFAQDVLGKARSVASNFTSSAPAPVETMKGAPQASPERPRVAVVARRTKQEEKEWKRDEKDRDKFIRKLFEKK